ncbi:hypothetical protein Tco_0669712 [Tanacetum coccineum]
MREDLKYVEYLEKEVEYLEKEVAFLKDKFKMERLDNQSIERDRLNGIRFMLDFVEFISFTFSDKEMISVIEAQLIESLFWDIVVCRKPMILAQLYVDVLSIIFSSLIPLSCGSFDVLVGMDLLSKRKFGIVCHEKVVRIPLEGDEILQVHGELTQGVVKTLMNTKVNEPKLSDISVVRDFIDVFPEMQELSEQLRELKDKGFIRPSHFPRGAPVLFMKKRIDDRVDQYERAVSFLRLDFRSGFISYGLHGDAILQRHHLNERRTFCVYGLCFWVKTKHSWFSLGLMNLGLVCKPYLGVISLPNHPTSNIEDAFSSNFPDYISASPDYSPASPGNTYSSSLNNTFGLVPIASPTPSLFHDDPYMKVMQAYYAKESPVPPLTIVPPSPMLSPMFNP